MSTNLHRYSFFITSVLLALFVVLIYAVIPHAVRIYELKKIGGEYIPITIASDFDRMNVQAGRYREILDGKLFSGEIDTVEHAGAPPLWPILSATLIAPFILITKSVFWGYILSDAFFPLVMFVSFFFLFRSITDQKWYAIAAAYSVMIFPQLVHLLPPSSVREFLTLLNGFNPITVGLYRPELSFLLREAFIPGGVFFVSFFFFLHSALTQSWRYRWLFVSFAYSMLFYLYLYHWVFATVLLGIMFLIFLYKKEYATAKDLLLSGSGGLLLSLPFWLTHFRLRQLPQYGELTSRIGIELGRGIQWTIWESYLLYIVLAGIVFFIYKKINKMQTGIFMISILASAIVVHNLQVVTGFNIQSDHWPHRVFIITLPIIWAGIIFEGYRILSQANVKLPRRTSALLLILPISLLTIHTTLKQFESSRSEAHAFTVDTEFMDAYAWINENTENGSVFMSPSLKTNIDLSVYSHAKLFLARAQNTVASEEELLDRLFYTYRFFNVHSDEFQKMINTQEGIFYFFTAKYRSRALDSYLAPERYPGYVLPENISKSLAENYEKYEMPKSPPYQLEYVFVGPRERAIVKPPNFDLPVVYESPSVTIYRYR